MDITKGTAIRVVRGKKVPLGTTGKVFWTGTGQYGPRLGFNDAAGVTHWTAASNVEVIAASAVAPVAAPPAGLFEDEDRGNAAEAQMIADEIAASATPARRLIGEGRAAAVVTVPRAEFDALVARVTLLETLLAAQVR